MFFSFPMDKGATMALSNLVPFFRDFGTKERASEETLQAGRPSFWTTGGGEGGRIPIVLHACVCLARSEGNPERGTHPAGEDVLFFVPCNEMDVRSCCFRPFSFGGGF